jgi:hypothetical protein
MPPLWTAHRDHADLRRRFGFCGASVVSATVDWGFESTRPPTAVTDPALSAPSAADDLPPPHRTLEAVTRPALCATVNSSAAQRCVDDVSKGVSVSTALQRAALEPPRRDAVAARPGAALEYWAQQFHSTRRVSVAVVPLVRREVEGRDEVCAVVLARRVKEELPPLSELEREREMRRRKRLTGERLRRARLLAAGGPGTMDEPALRRQRTETDLPDADDAAAAAGSPNSLRLRPSRADTVLALTERDRDDIDRGQAVARGVGGYDSASGASSGAASAADLSDDREFMMGLTRQATRTPSFEVGHDGARLRLSTHLALVTGDVAEPTPEQLDAATAEETRTWAAAVGQQVMFDVLGVSLATANSLRRVATIDTVRADGSTGRVVVVTTDVSAAVGIRPITLPVARGV